MGPLRKKFYVLLMKKGYLQIDFLFVILGFFLLFSFTYFQYLDRSDQYYEYQEAKEKKIQLAYICDLLVSTSGEPKNWEDGMLSDTVFFGLKQQNSSLLDINKTSIFFNDSNYLLIYSKINFSSIFYVNLKNSSGGILESIGENPIDPSLSTYEFCFTQNDSSLIILEVGMWE